jgi:hypothetical protein
VSARPTIARRQLAKMLAGTIGEEKAQEAVAGACSAAGLTAESLSWEEALAVLGRIAETPGVVGITARFAKSRMHLKAS